MKWKILGIAVCVFAILVSVAVPAAEAYYYPETYRYHQHLYAELSPEDEADDGTFNSHLPVLSINTGGKSIPGIPIDWDEEGNEFYSTTIEGDEMLKASLSVFDSEESCNRLTDEPTFSTDIRIRVRGNTSRYFAKKSYLVTFVDENDAIVNHDFLGMTDHHKWALHGPVLDKTLIRNYVFYNLAGEIMDYSPEVRFCEVFIDDEYKGLYLATEVITDGFRGNRLTLHRDKRGVEVTGYLLRVDRGSSEEEKNIVPFDTYTHLLPEGSVVNIVYPGTDVLDDEMIKDIKDDISYFEKCLYSYDYNDSKYGYSSFIDIYSFIDYFLINEITGNVDSGLYSTYIYKDISCKYKLCVWDFNNCCDNYIDETVSTEGFCMIDAIWMRMLIRDKSFNEELISRYRELRESIFSDEYLDDYIDSTVEYLGPAIDRNTEVWGHYFDKNAADMLKPAERNLTSYEDAVFQLKTYLHERLSWLDENIDSLYQYKSPSMNKEYTDTPS